MRLFCIALLLLLGLGAAAQRVQGAIEVQVQTERTNFLLFERLDLLVTLVNNSNDQILLDNDEDRPWLSFLVTKSNHLPVRRERTSNFGPLTLKPDETKTLRINITPLFLFRETGDYFVSAVLDLPGQQQILSAEIPFTILEGRQIFSVTRPIEGTDRIYQLVRFSPLPGKVELYLRVTDPAENLVYANYGLGELALFIDPAVEFDPLGDLHVLQPVSFGTYLYTRTDPAGRLLHQTIFRTWQTIPPRLAKLSDGNVIVNGGKAEEPNQPRERLSDTLAKDRSASPLPPAQTPGGGGEFAP